MIKTDPFKGCVLADRAFFEKMAEMGFRGVKDRPLSGVEISLAIGGYMSVEERVVADREMLDRREGRHYALLNSLDRMVSAVDKVEADPAIRREIKNCLIAAARAAVVANGGSLSDDELRRF